MISLVEGAYYLGLWFLEGNGQDWLAVAWRTPDGEQRLDFRFRHYTTAKGVFDGEDDKHEENLVLAPTVSEAEIIKHVDTAMNGLVKRGFCKSRLPWKVRTYKTFVPVRGDARKFWLAIKDLPFVHWSTDPELIADAAQRADADGIGTVKPS